MLETCFIGKPRSRRRDVERKRIGLDGWRCLHDNDVGNTEDARPRLTNTVPQDRAGDRRTSMHRSLLRVLYLQSEYAVCTQASHAEVLRMSCGPSGNIQFEVSRNRSACWRVRVWVLERCTVPGHLCTMPNNAQPWKFRWSRLKRLVCNRSRPERQIFCPSLSLRIPQEQSKP